MRKIILMAVVLLFVGVVAAWFSMQSLPSWADESNSQELNTSQQFSQQINKQGLSNFLGGKVSDIIKGRVSFNEVEFNAILLASLQSNDDGRKLLSASEYVKTFIKDDHIEIVAIVDLNKLQKVEPKASEVVKKINQLLPLLNKSRLAITLYATPMARNNKLAVKDDFHLKIGVIPIPNGLLRTLGANVEGANHSELAIKNLSIKSVNLEPKKINLGVSARF